MRKYHEGHLITRAMLPSSALPGVIFVCIPGVLAAQGGGQRAGVKIPQYNFHDFRDPTFLN